VPSLAIDDRQVDVWYVHLEKIADARLLDKYRLLLPAEEAQRERRFLAEKARVQHLVGRALLRTTLSLYGTRHPTDWVFSYNAHGKPSGAGDFEPRLQFNLSHTDGLVVCAFARSQEIGIDVERADRRPEALALAQRFFAPAEAALVAQSSPEEQQARFLQFWTLKESFIKARGTGLSMPLDQFAFSVEPGRRAAISFSVPCGEDPRDWQFAQFHFGSQYRGALAVRQPETDPISIRVWETVPLLWQSEAKWLPACAASEWTL